MPNVSTHLEDELSLEMARLAQSMRVGGLRQAIELDLRRAYGPSLKQLGDAIEMSAGASNRRPERHYIVAVGRWRLRARSDKGRAAARLEYREGFLRHVAADSIEDGVAIAHNLSEVPGVVVDDFIGSEPAHIFVVCCTRGRDDMGANMFGKLNGEAGDPVSPGCSFNVSSIALIAVRPVSAKAAALTCDSPSGFLATIAALTAIFSA
jgi:hypothetical protein